MHPLYHAIKDAALGSTDLARGAAVGPLKYISTGQEPPRIGTPVPIVLRDGGYAETPEVAVGAVEGAAGAQ